ncbi:MAG: ribulokinase [Planctomycetota bacterium]|nr:ribulokinase [Planctomycetota bacterium]
MPDTAALGLDFGTESVRALLVDTRTGQELGVGVAPYAHGVIDRALPHPDRTIRLGDDWALQDPRDYLDGLIQAVREALASARSKVERIAGIGVDFTACTVLPARADGTPLCFDSASSHQPHAYVKLWKHHGAQAQADALNRLARERSEGFLRRYGAGVSCEWMIPKAHELAEEAPDLFDAAEKWIEAGDWIVWQLTGVESRNACAAGYKGCWSAAEGLPSDEFLAALHPRLASLRGKMEGPVRPAGARVGGLTPEWAKQLELPEGLPVGAAIIDAHAAVPASGLSKPGDLGIILGTSFCHMLLGAPGARDDCEGIAGSVKEGILPGLMGYEAGQAGGGDLWAWCVRTCGNEKILQEAHTKKWTLHESIALRAAGYKPGGTGLLALDWLNGNRSPLNRPELSGLIVGLTLATKPEAIYRALQESLAFGTRVIVENFERQGLPVSRIVTSGGIAQKDPAFLQILADVSGRQIEVARSAQACAVGAAILGAVAAGAEGGGYDSFEAAAGAMGGVKAQSFKPQAEAGKVYDELFHDYVLLADHFGRGGCEVMARLRALRGER